MNGDLLIPILTLIRHRLLRLGLALLSARPEPRDPRLGHRKDDLVSRQKTDAESMTDMVALSCAERARFTGVRGAPNVDYFLLFGIERGAVEQHITTGSRGTRVGPGATVGLSQVTSPGPATQRKFGILAD